MSTICWQFWIDVGGTFTDCIGISPDGRVRQFKTLSSGITRGRPEQSSGQTIIDPLRTSDPEQFWTGAACRLLNSAGVVLQTTVVKSFDAQRGSLELTVVPDRTAVAYELDLNLPAPVLAIRWILALRSGDECPPVRVRFGTTRGTNALLTRTGARTALITTRGFADVPLIGNQDRPDLFAVNIRRPEPLFAAVFEVEERTAGDGSILCAPDLIRIRQDLQRDGLSTERFDSVAICLLNAYCNPVHEEQLETVVRQLGFVDVSRSSEVSGVIRFVPRCDTTILDAYLNPVLRDYLDIMRHHLPGSEIRVMTSTGGLVASPAFRGRDCVLSGPAGGIVGFSKAALQEGYRSAIGFDMGGTSTDVARFANGFEFENETTKAGVRIQSPVLAIETVAAGGGSICGFDGTRLFVGPQSAGANPGPACYGAGGPLTVTDLNVFLGRVLPHHFPFPLQMETVRQRLQQLQDHMTSAGAATAGTSLHHLAEGLLRIANDNMVQAIRKVSVAKGYHPADHVLVSFGGAAGQHACSVARSLGIRTILIHPFAGILSAFGMGQADVRVIRQASVLQPLNEATLKGVAAVRERLEEDARREVMLQGVAEAQIQKPQLSLELRYSGTDSGLMLPEDSSRTFRESFESEHQRLFGYVRPEKPIEVATLRIEVVGRAAAIQNIAAPAVAAPVAATTEQTSVWFGGVSYSAVVIHRDQLRADDCIPGPAIICEPTSTIVIEPGCRATVAESGTVVIEILKADVGIAEIPCHPQDSASAETPHHDPVLLEVFNNQFVSIAAQMGETLRRTSTSTNVRERLDFSCALFDHEGRLVVNAPHVPVHLGAMGETVRAIMRDFPAMQPGDVYITNDPYRGGSHLPDVTVITPVFTSDRSADINDHRSPRPAFFVANRAHHAEIGGIVPGSMPPFSTTLAEEGVLISRRKLVDAGTSCENELRHLLSTGSFPTRAINDNIADLAAQVAANACGVQHLQALAGKHSTTAVQSYMKHIQDTSAGKMRQCLERLPDGVCRFEDSLDDGTVIAVSINIAGDTATVDFTGTAGVHEGNLNANPAITTSAVLYSFRCLLDQDVPLNAGVLEPVSIIVPPGLLNPPPGDSPETSPAVVGGNVETSQRIVDVVLGALQLAAASQGTMNNLTFGDATFGYYETICGGAGATSTAAGADAVHTHMTNTRLTDPEVLEQRYPVRLRQFSIRRQSGGAGQHRGGNGVVREIEFLKPLHVSMLSQRRGNHRPYGLGGGQPGHAGCNSLAVNGEHIALEGCFSREVQPGTVLKIETPGGGGWSGNT
ncbi:MAG: hydantoinase B/oxoprolinase family protein [Planctomycetaceae bacterium]